MEQEHPAEQAGPTVKSADQQGLVVMGALGVTVLLRMAAIHAHLAQNDLIRQVSQGEGASLESLQASDDSVRMIAMAQLALLVITGVLFLRWMRTTAEAAKRLGASFPWSGKDLVLAFVIPIVSLKRPYTVMSDLHASLEPDAVPEPEAQVRPDESGHYRGVKIEEPAPAPRLPQASIGLWWAAFWIGNVLANVGSRINTGNSVESLINQNGFTVAAFAVDIASAVLAIFMVRAVTGRLLERFRRVRYSDPAALRALGVIA